MPDASFWFDLQDRFKKNAEPDSLHDDLSAECGLSLEPSEADLFQTPLCRVQGGSAKGRAEFGQLARRATVGLGFNGRESWRWLLRLREEALGYTVVSVNDTGIDFVGVWRNLNRFSAELCFRLGVAAHATGADPFSERLNRLRQEAGLTWEALEGSGVSRRQVFQHKAGDGRPSRQSIRRYAAFFTSRLGRNITEQDLR